MTPRLSARCAAPLAGALLTTGLLAPSPATAGSAVLVEPSTYVEVYPGYDVTTQNSCTFDGDTDETPAAPQENGPAGVTVVSVAGDIVTPGGQTEGSVSGEYRLSTLVRTADGAPELLRMRGRGALDFSGTGPVCEDAYVDFEAGLNAYFTLSETTWVTVTGRNAGMDGLLEIDTDGDEDADAPDYQALDLELRELESEATVRVPLPAGRWEVDLDSGIDAPDATDLDPAFDMDLVFTRPGERLSLRGTAGALVRPAASRSCADGTIPVRVTGNRADARDIRRVELAVDGRTVRTLRRPDAGQLVRLATRDRGAATVSAKVFLDPARRGGAIRQRAVTATYEACARPIDR